MDNYHCKISKLQGFMDQLNHKFQRTGVTYPRERESQIEMQENCGKLMKTFALHPSSHSNLRHKLIK